MKLCLLCGQMSPDDAATCAQDGEASWASRARLVAEEPALDVVVTEEPKVARKKAAR